MRWWLTISYYLVNPLVRIKVNPNFVTLLAIPFGLGYIVLIDSWWAPLLLALSLLLDGIDGSIAIMRGRITKFGAALDAVVDRIVEILWIIGLYRLGAPWHWLAVAGLASYIQEYMRARVASLVIEKVVMVTFAERPVRASLIFVALIANQISIDIVNQVVIVWAVAQSLSALILLRSLRSLLLRVQR